MPNMKKAMKTEALDVNGIQDFKHTMRQYG